MVDKRKVGSRRKPSDRIRQVTVDLNSAMRSVRSPRALALLSEAKTLINLAKKAETSK